MMRIALVGCAFTLSLASLAPAQTAKGPIVPVPEPPAMGVVTGHVTCTDTQRPARLAQVRLLRVPADADKGAAGSAATPGDAVETSLDGSYTLRNVRPGDYYVEVDKEGYLTPIAGFSRKELGAPDAAVRRRMADTLRAIHVENDAATQADVSLVRGAAASGMLTYDDGSPAAGLPVQVLTKGQDGKWQRANYSGLIFGDYVRTDDYGRFRRDGLPAGEYAIEADLKLSDYESSTVKNPMLADSTVEVRMEKTRFALPLYSGDVLRRKSIVAFTLGEGEERTGLDLVFPISKLHTVEGQVLARDGHAVNGGEVKLVYADDADGDKVTDTAIAFREATFTMEFVPEGDYTLKVSGAKDRTQVADENPVGSTPHTHMEDKVSKTYGPAEQPLKVEGEMSGVNVMVPEAESSKSKVPASLH